MVLFHAAALWAIQSGLVRRTVEMVHAVEIISELITPPAPPKIEPAPPPRPEPPPPDEPAGGEEGPAGAASRTGRRSQAPPAPNAPAGVTAPQPPAPPVRLPSRRGQPTGSSRAAPAPAKIEPPMSNADYLQNPKPPYPPLSKRLGEQGTVVVVLVGADGVPGGPAEISQSCGYERLDRLAHAAQ